MLHADSISIAVEGDDRRARALAARLAVADRDHGDGASMTLAYHDDRLELRGPGDSPGHGLAVELGGPRRILALRHRSRRQPLARALGKGKRVVDATAGLGGDAMLMASWGREVIALERSPVLAALLRDGLRRAGDPFALLEGDGRELLEKIRPRPEVVYLDPMYPPKRKRSALPPKPVRLIRELVGDDPDAKALAAVARSIAGSRLVVKRPRHAEPLLDSPDLQFEGKMVRYEVYL